MEISKVIFRSIHNIKLIYNVLKLYRKYVVYLLFILTTFKVILKRIKRKRRNKLMILYCTIMGNIYIYIYSCIYVQNLNDCGYQDTVKISIILLFFLHLLQQQKEGYTNVTKQR